MSSENQITENSRRMAAWRRQVAEQQRCANCGGNDIAVVIFGRLRIHSEQLLDELFGMGNWVDGGDGLGSNQTFFCKSCSTTFKSDDDHFGILGKIDLSA